MTRRATALAAAIALLGSSPALAFGRHSEAEVERILSHGGEAEDGERAAVSHPTVVAKPRIIRRLAAATGHGLMETAHGMVGGVAVVGGIGVTAMAASNMMAMHHGLMAAHGFAAIAAGASPILPIVLAGALGFAVIRGIYKGFKHFRATGQGGMGAAASGGGGHGLLILLRAQNRNQQALAGYDSPNSWFRNGSSSVPGVEANTGMLATHNNGAHSMSGSHGGGAHSSMSHNSSGPHTLGTSIPWSGDTNNLGMGGLSQMPTY